MSVLHAPLHAVGCTLECLHVLHAVLSNSMQWCVDCGLKHVLQTIKCTGQYSQAIIQGTYVACPACVVHYVYHLGSKKLCAVYCIPLMEATHCHKDTPRKDGRSHPLLPTPIGPPPAMWGVGDSPTQYPLK